MLVERIFIEILILCIPTQSAGANRQVSDGIILIIGSKNQIISAFHFLGMLFDFLLGLFGKTLKTIIHDHFHQTFTSRQ